MFITRKVYGAGAAGYGEFPIGSQVIVDGVQSEIIWSFRPGGNGMHTYVVAPAGGFPVEVLASDLQSEVERN